jgi:hypothetical protein
MLVPGGVRSYFAGRCLELVYVRCYTLPVPGLPDTPMLIFVKPSLWFDLVIRAR